MMIHLKQWGRKILFVGMLCVLGGGNALACPFCNIDGWVVRNFVLTVFGLALTGFFFLLIWSIKRGQYKDPEAPKYRLLELDRKTGVRL